MSKFAEKFINFFGYGYRDDEEPETDEENVDNFEEEFYEVPVREEKRRERKSGKVVDFPGSKSEGNIKIISYRPVSYQDTRNLVDNLKSNKPIILNLESIDNAVAQRILDSMYGACYALGGELKRISNRIFAVIPANYELIGNSDGIRE